MSHFAEQQTEWIINNILVNGGWIIDNKPKKNVYFQKARPEHQHLLESFSKKKGYKKPDYILYQEDKLAGIIEAKRGGELLDKALKQATEYAEMLKAPLVFASNGAYVETYHLTKKKPLFINGEKVDKLIKYKEAVEFIKSDNNEIYTFPIELIKSKEDLIRIFKKVNNLLRKANIFAGYDRISEFSSILFLKLISEQEGEKSYWNSIKKQDDDFLLSYLNGTVIKALEDKYNGGVFSEINLKKASVMRQIINIVDPLVLSDIKTDIKGDAFEYFLKNMNQADNDLGQYFTPRHIVKAMVHLIDPKFKETIYDPFCGTGGFLIEAFNHIKENSIIKTEEDRKILRENTLFGRDATKVSTIAKKNMILHGDGHSNIEELDSLEHPIQKKMSAILTNIPFSLKDVDYTNLYHNGLGKKNGDAVCVLHCLDALEEGGRMAIIVPEGFLFKKELKEVRKFLLSRANLELIISLPQGVFLPYTGVKTDILYFTNAHKPEVREGYYYFEVKNDGFTLDAHRRKTESVNDIHKLEAINIRKGEKELLKEQGFDFIDFESVINNNYNLVGSFYRNSENFSSTLMVNEKKSTITLGEVIQIICGERITKKNNEGQKYPVYGGGGISFFTNQFNHSNALVISRFGMSKECTRYIKRKFWLLDSGFIVKSKTDKILQSFIDIILLNMKDVIFSCGRGMAQRNIDFEQFKNIKIPFLPISLQQEIVDEINTYQKIIDGAKQIVSNWKPWVNIKNNEYDQVCLKDLLQNIKSKFIKIKKQDCNILGKYPVISQERGYNIGYIDLDSGFISKQDLPLILFGDHTLEVKYIENEFFVGADGVKLLKLDNEVLAKYVYYFMKSKDFIKQIQQQISGKYYTRHWTIAKNVNIPLPPPHIQQEIVEQLEQERKMIDSQKEIIKLFEAKIQSRLNALWQSEEENELGHVQE